MIENMRKAKIVTESLVGQAKSTVVPAKESLEIMTDLLKRNPENYLCDSTLCLWCREIERRMRLIHKIPNQRWFHKYPLLRLFIDISNYFRISDSGIITLVRDPLQPPLEKILRKLKILE
jgi:hypothetical protein